jgi:hypothetical protein
VIERFTEIAPIMLGVFIGWLLGTLIALWLGFVINFLIKRGC